MQAAYLDIKAAFDSSVNRKALWKALRGMRRTGPFAKPDRGSTP